MSSAPHVRQSGGVNQGFGHFQDDFGEHLDENAMQSAVQQKALAQQATSSAQQTTGGNAIGTPTAAEPGHAAEPIKPRELGTLTEELIERPAQDILAGLKSFLDLNSLLNIDSVHDDPATQARKRQMLERMQRFNEEQQHEAQERYKEEMQKKQQEERQKQLEKQRQQQAAQSLQMPSSPRKGPIGPADQHKPAAVQKLEQDRKTLGGPQSVN